MKTTKELLAEYNSLANKPLASWKQSREKLAQRVEALKKDKKTTVVLEKNVGKTIFRADNERRFTPINEGNYFPADGEKIGAFMQRLLLTNSFTTTELVEMGKKFYPSSKISPSDIAWHRAFLKRSGTPAKLVRVTKQNVRYIVGA